MRALRVAAGGALVVGLLAGCGGGPATGDVSGTVTYDGKPVEAGSIAFYPDNGPSAGGAITNGKFAVSKVPVGTARVRLSGVKDAKKQKMYDDPSSPFVMTSAELLPAKYSDDKATELRYDIQAGVQTKDFDLAK